LRDEASDKSGMVDGREADGGYEAPALVALGNLHDLLAGEGGTRCDGNGDLTDGNGQVIPVC
jgi:hypothetical protein